MAEKDQANYLDTQTAAALLMVTPRTIQYLAKDGWIKRAGPGKWPLVALVQGYIKSLKDETARRTKISADSRVRDARAAEIEMRMAVKARELIPLAEAVYAVEEIAGAFLAAVSALPAQITRDQRERARLETILDKTRGVLSARFAAIGAALRTGEPIDTPATEDDAG